LIPSSSRVGALLRDSFTLARHSVTPTISGLVGVGENILKASPHTRAVGLARSLLAASTGLTLALTPQSSLFFRSTSYPTGAVCDARLSFISIHCMVGDSVGLSVWLSLAVLAAVCSGYWPAVTAVPHWWIAWSLNTSSPVRDGGDQVAAALTLLIIPLALVDRRPNHWLNDLGYAGRGFASKCVGHAAIGLLAVQAMVVYGHAAAGKLAVPEWSNGSALWYWIQDPAFAPPAVMDVALRFAHSTAFGSIAVNYGVIAWELALVLAVLAAKWVRTTALIGGILFHGAIAVTFGLWSFFLAMVALLILALVRPSPPAVVVTS
jgi:antimicrobial peptide system SdpB family protein